MTVEMTNGYKIYFGDTSCDTFRTFSIALCKAKVIKIKCASRLLA
jgi:hypothetical protein